MAIWQPHLEGRTGPKYQQIVAALADDIASGRLRPGMRLPPHRILAYALGISPNTTRRAYADCVTRGLLRGEVGRGTFVRLQPEIDGRGDSADLSRPAVGPIDFSRNLPFPGPAASHLSRTLEELGRNTELQAFLDYQAEAGLRHHLESGVDWLARTGVTARPGEVVITCGAQHGILAALMAVTRPGDVLLTEELTYAPVRMMADRFGLHPHGVAMDQNGLLPEALDDACRRRAVKVLYLMPTLQTPTTIILSEERRRAIVDIARRHDLILIEDDVYGPLVSARVTPVAGLAPERTIYLSSCSKCLAPGLRVAFLRAPEALAPALRDAVTLSCWMPPPLMVEIASRWIADGTADRLTAVQQSEAAARQKIAREVLAGHKIFSDRAGFHLWLSLPACWQATAFCAAAAKHGVLLTEGSAFAIETASSQPAAVRLSLSHEPTRERVINGLNIVADLLRGQGGANALVI